MTNLKKIKKIIVIDDDSIQVKLLECALREHGFEVKSTTDAPEGLQMTMDEKPDLVILDVMMPVINGYNFCKLVKTEERLKNTAIILATARDEMEDIKIGMEVGADAYLTKPVDIKELLKAIRIVQSMREDERVE